MQMTLLRDPTSLREKRDYFGSAKAGEFSGRQCLGEGGGFTLLSRSARDYQAMTNVTMCTTAPSVQLGMTETGLERWLSLPSKNLKSRRRRQKHPGRQRELCSTDRKVGRRG